MVQRNSKADFARCAFCHSERRSNTDVGLTRRQVRSGI
jgi:hypothetical protein